VRLRTSFHNQCAALATRPLSIKLNNLQSTNPLQRYKVRPDTTVLWVKPGTQMNQRISNVLGEIMKRARRFRTVHAGYRIHQGEVHQALRSTYDSISTLRFLAFRKRSMSGSSSSEQSCTTGIQRRTVKAHTGLPQIHAVPDVYSSIPMCSVPIHDAAA
jgi:hypothetical protein